MNHVEPDIADADHVAVVQECGIVALREGVAPVVASFIGEEELRAGGGGKLARAGDEVGVNVRLRHVPQAKLLLLDGANVLRDVAIRIDDDGVAGRLTGDEVARLSQFLVVEALEEHHPN